jgi:antitoxin HicB
MWALCLTNAMSLIWNWYFFRTQKLEDAMQSSKRSKVGMAQRMATSRSQLDRVLDPSNLSIQPDTLIKAASAVGRTVEIRLKRDTKRTRVISA